MLYNGVFAILNSRKYPKSVSKFLQEALRMEIQCCGKTQVSIYPQKIQNLNQYLMKPDKIC
jgi:hypothetical protein